MTALRHTLTMVAVSLSMGVAIAAEPPGASTCETWPVTSSALRTVLGQRAIDAATIAALASDSDESGLLDFVERDAHFTLGRGDWSRELLSGSAGLRALMTKLQADHYRFDEWNYLQGTENPCDSHEVTIEFTSKALKSRAEVKFRFLRGKIVEAKGWEWSTSSGAFPVTKSSR